MTNHQADEMHLMIPQTEEYVTARDPGQNRGKERENLPPDLQRVDLQGREKEKEKGQDPDPEPGMKGKEVAKETLVEKEKGKENENENEKENERGKEKEKVEDIHVHLEEGRGQVKELDQKEDLVKGRPCPFLLEESLDPSHVKGGPVPGRKIIEHLVFPEVNEITAKTLLETLRAETTEDDLLECIVLNLLQAYFYTFFVVHGSWLL